MPIISFWGNNEKETGQTISTIAVSTMMAIDHNMKVLMISTGFKDKTMEESFWVENSHANLQKMLGLTKTNASNIESGIEGLSRVVQSNIIRPGIVENYVKAVFTNRLDVLISPNTDNPKDYVTIAQNYPKIIGSANMDYNMVFVDIDKRMPAELQKEILLQSDIIVVTINQTNKGIKKLTDLMEQNEMFQKGNILVLIWKYDKFSKYNAKNVTRFLKEKRMISAIPYNTIFFEATTEGQVADYFLRYANITDITDRNAVFINENKRACENILAKIQELGLKK